VRHQEQKEPATCGDSAALRSKRGLF
jgi:hypothetical protein